MRPRAPVALAAALLLGLVLAPPALAGKEKKPADKLDKELYHKMQPLVVEFWDRDGVFHFASVELVLQLKPKQKVSVGKVTQDKLRRALGSIPYETYREGNAASMVKNTATQIIKQDPEADKIEDVLLSRVLFR